MIEQLNNAVRFFGFFTASKTGKTGLTVTVDVRNPAGTLVVTGGAASEVGGGFYSYTLASGSVNAEGEYTAVFKTADSTVDQQHIPSLWVVGRAGVENLDALVSSRSTYNGSDTAGTTPLLSRITGAIPLATDYTAARAAKLDNLDATISSRNATAPDNASIAAIKAKTDNLPAAFPVNFSTLSIDGAGRVLLQPAQPGVTIPTVTSLTGYTAPDSAATIATAVWGSVSRTLTASNDPTAAQIADAVWDEARAGHTTAGTFGLFLDTQISGISVGAGGGSGATAAQIWDYLFVSAATPGSFGKLIKDNLDATISSRNATAPDNAGIAAIKAKTDALPANPASAQQITSAQTAVIAAMPPAPDNVKIAAIHADYQQRTQPVALPAPAPEGYGISGALDVSALTEEQSDQLAFIAEKASLITSGKITVTTPVVEGGEGIVLIRGDDYRARDGRELDFTREVWADLTGATVVLKVGSLEIIGDVLAARVVRFELTATQTDSLATGQHRHSIEATLSNGDVLTLLRGRTTVLNRS